MAISSDTTVKRTVLKFEVDAPQVQSELNRIDNKSRDTARRAVDYFKNVGSDISGGFSGIKGAVGFLGELNQALELAGKAMQLVSDYGDKLDLKAAAAGVSFEGMSRAARGLKTDMELLEHAATLSRGAFKLNQQQLEMVEKAMFALEEEGRSSAEVWSAMESALTKGVTRPLEQLGIIVDTTGLKMDENGIRVGKYEERQAALARILDAVALKAKEADGAVLDEADAMQASVVQLQNYWDQAKEGLARLVLELKPLVDGLAKAVAYVTYLADKIPQIPGMSGAQSGFGASSLVAGGAGAATSGGAIGFAKYVALGPLALPAAGLGAARSFFSSDSNTSGDPRAAYRQFGAMTVEEWRAAQAAMQPDAQVGQYIPKRLESPRAGSRGQSGGSFDLGVDYSRETHVTLGSDLPFDVKMSTDMLESAGEIDAAMNGIYDSMLTVEERYANWMAGQPTLLEKLGLQDTDAMDAAKAAVSGFSSAYVEAMRSMAQGSMDASEVLKTILGKTVGAVGDELLALGAAELAKAVAMTVSYNPAAGLHYAAAGAYTAGGLAAHVAASAIMGKPSQSKVDPAAGSGGKGGGSGSGSRAGGGGGSGSGGNGGRDVVYVYGDPFAQDSPRNRALTAERAIRRVLPNFGEDS